MSPAVVEYPRSRNMLPSQMKRPERVAAVDSRGRHSRRRECRAPQQEDSVNNLIYADVVELVDSVDLGAVTSVKVFLSRCHCEPDRLSGVAIRSLKAGSPVFINRGSG